MYETLAAKNSQSAQLWKAMPEEEKKKFKEEADATNAGLKPLNAKHETHKILSHLEDMVNTSLNAMKYSILCRTFRWYACVVSCGTFHFFRASMQT